MAKKTKTKSGAPKKSGGSGRQESPAQLRKGLARLDHNILKSLNERARLVKKLAAGDDSAFDPAAEQSQVSQLLEANQGPLSEHAVRSIFREVISGTRQLVAPLKITYLGPPYSYSHLAAIERFGSSVELAPVATIAAVFEELNRGHSDYGIVPLENSTDGRVVDTLDMFVRLPVKICGEVRLRIHHNLLGKCTRSEVTEVYSKPQALSQCRDWLAKHLPAARLVEMTSTAAAAQLAAEKPGAAAIASLQAAANYNLNVVAEHIEDNPNNITRFAVIGSEICGRTGQDKTALMYELPHQPGALADAMAIFKRNRLNLTWIESFPLPGSKNEYIFFVEFEAHQDDAKAKRALESLRRKTARLEILGSYVRSPLIG